MKLDLKLINEREVSRELEKLAKAAGVQGKQFADEAARVGVRALVRTAQPYGMAGKAKKQGENAVMRDVGRAFTVLPDHARGGDIIRTTGGAASHHHSVRDSRGRVGRGVRKRKILAGVFFIYRKSVLMRVGTAKGAMSTAAAPLGIKGVQKWITRSRKHGTAKRKGRMGNVSWHLAAMPEHVGSDHVLGQRGAAAVLKSTERNLKRSFEARIKRRLKAAEKKL